MARRITGSDEILFSAGGLSSASPASGWTLAFVTRLVSAGDYWYAHDGGSYLEVYEGGGGGVNVWCDGDNVNIGLGGDATANGGWTFHAITRPSGTGSQTVSGWRYRYGSDAWSTSSASGTAGSAAFTEVGLGFAGDVDTALWAWWNRVLTDAEIRNLPFSLAHIMAADPDALCVLDQSATGQKVIDLTGGGANQSSITGTSVSTLSVPILGYGAPVILPRAASGGPAPALWVPRVIVAG